jgi:hypothetical protein
MIISDKTEDKANYLHAATCFEKLTVGQEISYLILNMMIHYLVHKSLPLDFEQQKSLPHILLVKIHFNIILPFMPRSPSYLKFSDLKYVM